MVLHGKGSVVKNFTDFVRTFRYFAGCLRLVQMTAWERKVQSFCLHYVQCILTVCISLIICAQIQVSAQRKFIYCY